MKTLTFICACLLTWLITTGSAVSADTAVYEEIREMDQEFFSAFNACDLTTMGRLFSRDLEFYHDVSGYSGYTQTMKVTQENCQRNLGLKRELVPGSMHVDPLGDFGAVQRGRHMFCHEVNGEDDCGVFEFVHVWKKQEKRWLLHRVISYGH